MARQLISVSDGAVEYTYPVTLTESTGKDITLDPVVVSLGTYSAPGPWAPPDKASRPTPSSAVVQVLVSAGLNLVPGDYFLWILVHDSPEVVPRRTDLRVTVA